MGVSLLKDRLSEVDIMAPDFWKLPHCDSGRHETANATGSFGGYWSPKFMKRVTRACAAVGAPRRSGVDNRCVED